MELRQARTTKKGTLRSRTTVLALGALGCLALAAGPASAQVAPNQTLGFGNGRLLTFTYGQSFDCVDEPTQDLDFNGVPAQSDPGEMQTPICQVITEPKHDPTGGDIKHTSPLYVLVPMFGSDTNPADAMPCPNGGRPGELCGSTLGSTLISIFGYIPNAWLSHPAVATQCPDPNNPVPGTCTMHASSIDLSTLLGALGITANPPTGNIFLPTPNHSHVVDNSDTNTGSIWWEVRPVLIFDSADWPAADGSTGITSARAMDAAENAGRAVEVGSNFFLFFKSRMNGTAQMAAMPGM
jgi:hypothetical protein